MDLKVELDLGGVFAGLDELETSIRERAAPSAINKTLAKGRTAMVREISREFNVSAAFVRERLNVVKARWTGSKARLAGALDGSNGRKRSANLIHFVQAATQAQRDKAAKAGTVPQLRFKIKRKGATKQIPGAFIGNKGRTVFKREGKARLPIKALSTIDIPQMFNTKRLNKIVRDGMLTDFSEIYQHEVEYFTRRFNQRRAG